MSIVKMKKLSVIAPRSGKDELLKELMLLGCVEPGQAEAPEDTKLRRAPSLAEERREEQARLQRALEILDQYAPVKTKLFAPLDEVSCSDFLDDSATGARLDTADALIGLDSRIRRIQSESARERGVEESLRPWDGFGLPLNLSETASTACTIGTVPGSADMKALETALEEAAPEAQLFTVSSSKEQRYVFLLALKEEYEDALNAVRGFGFAQSSLKSEGRTPEAAIRAARERLDRLAEEEEDLLSEVRALSSQRAGLKIACDLTATKIAREEAGEKLLATDSAVCLSGWVSEPEAEKLAETLEKHGCAWALEDPSEEEAPEVPVKLKNNILTKPLMMVTEMYSLPSYDGVDPNPLILPWFCAFFGIMYADMGYGIILLVLGLLATRFLKLRGTMKYMAGLLKLCGITTFIFGFLFGSLFGDAVPVLSDMLGLKHAELWSLIDPLKQPMVMLIGSLAVGAVHLIVGMGIHAVMLIRDGKWYDALMDVGSWWLLFAGIALGALGKGWWVAIAGAAALICTQGRDKPTIFGKFFGGLYSLYDITSYLGDILSYTRLMALLLAGSVIASVVNVLGSLTGSIAAFIVIFLIGHIFNMGINIIGTYVHAARLQYLEFFGKFYRDGGRAFAPLSIRTKYVEVIKEEQ